VSNERVDIPSPPLPLSPLRVLYVLPFCCCRSALFEGFSLLPVPRWPQRVVREVSFFEYVSPWSFHTFRWSPTLSPRRYIAAWILAIVALIIDMTAFFLKTLLWVPPLHPLSAAEPHTDAARQGQHMQLYAMSAAW